MPTYGRFTRYVLIVAVVGVSLLASWHIAKVLLLVFGAVLLAVAIRAGGDAIARLLPIPARWGSLVTVALVAAGLTALTAMLGDEMAAQLADLRAQWPAAMARAQDALRETAIGRNALDALRSAVSEGFSVQHAVTAASATFGVLSDLLIVLLLALYLSFSPRGYLDGTVQLAPLRHQSDVRTALHDSGHALRRWLLGQLVSMTTVGVLTGMGLWLVGVPNAAVLGLVAGLLEFVPILGPIAAAVPGILLALAAGPQTALYATLVYFAVQQLEGALIMPLAQRWAVHLPPALALVTIVVFGVLFGIPGVLFATPLTVVIMVLVKRFYLDRREPALAAARSADGDGA
jgi:predicted PurR-regulated permease PerM